jgi:hypothetical protein
VSEYQAEKMATKEANKICQPKNAADAARQLAFVLLKFSNQFRNKNCVPIILNSIEPSYLGTGKRMEGGSLGHGVAQFIYHNDPGRDYVKEMKEWLANIGYHFKNDSITESVGKSLNTQDLIEECVRSPTLYNMKYQRSYREKLTSAQWRNFLVEVQLPVTTSFCCYVQMGDQILKRYLLSPHTGQSAALTKVQLERLGEGSSQNPTHLLAAASHQNPIVPGNPVRE